MAARCARIAANWTHTVAKGVQDAAESRHRAVVCWQVAAVYTHLAAVCTQTAAAATVTKSKATVTGLTSGTKYWFRVRAIGATGPGPWSDPATKIAP